MVNAFFCLSIFSGFGTPGDVAERHLVQERFLSQPGGPHFSRAAAQPRPGPSVPQKGEKPERLDSFQLHESTGGGADGRGDVSASVSHAQVHVSELSACHGDNCHAVLL